MMQKKTYFFLDIIKYIFSICVVFMHLSPLNKIEPHINFLLINGFFRIIVPFFFVSSSYFLFGKKYLDIIIIINYIKRLIILLFFWNTVIIILTIFFKGQHLSINQILFSYFYNNTPLWYIEALIKGTLLIYFISKYCNWNTIFIIFFIITTIIYCPANFYYGKAYIIFKYINSILMYTRIDSFYFIALGGLLASKKINGIKSQFLSARNIQYLILIFSFFLLLEASLFKYISIKYNIDRNPRYYFSSVFLVFLLFYYCIIYGDYIKIINKLKPFISNPRQKSSIIYLSHQSIKIVCLALIPNILGKYYELFLFFIIVFIAHVLAHYLVCFEKTTKYFSKYVKYLY